MSRATSATVAACAGDCCGPYPDDCVGWHAGRYLVAIHRLTDEGDPPFSTADVSAMLGVEAPSTTEMLGKLADRSLVEHENYCGAELTDRGETVARELRWRQQAVRSFFASALDLPLERERASRIGYVLPRDAVERLDRLAEA